MNRRDLFKGAGAMVPVLIPATMVPELSAAMDTKVLEWTTDMPTIEGQYLRRNPAVHSFTRVYVHNYMLPSEMNPIEPTNPPMQWFGPLPMPWEGEE